MNIEQPTLEDVYDIDNIDEAFDEMSEGKKEDKSLLNFALYRDEVEVNAHEHLVHRTYFPNGHNSFYIREPKLRHIVAPKLFDRLIHHALMRVVMPVFEAHFNQQSFACRKDMGALNACLRYQAHIRSAYNKYGKNFFVISLDIKNFFGSINHAVLKVLLRRLFKDEGIRWLFDTIIDSYSEDGLPGIGLPIGFLPSQAESGLIGTPIDYFCTDVLGIKHYVRYADDIRIICGSRQEAMDILYALDELTYTKLQLRLHEKKTNIKLWKGKDTFCGYKVAAHHLEIKASTLKRSERRILKKMELYKEGKLELSNLWDTSQSLLAILKHTTTQYNEVAENCLEFVRREEDRLMLEGMTDKGAS